MTFWLKINRYKFLRWNSNLCETKYSCYRYKIQYCTKSGQSVIRNSEKPLLTGFHPPAGLKLYLSTLPLQALQPTHNDAASPRWLDVDRDHQWEGPTQNMCFHILVWCLTGFIPWLSCFSCSIMLFFSQPGCDGGCTYLYVYGDGQTLNRFSTWLIRYLKTHETLYTHLFHRFPCRQGNGKSM